MPTASTLITNADATLQLTSLHGCFDKLHQAHGDSAHRAIYGAGCINQPELCLVFMNPTARNISADPDRTGLRAPRLGLKQTRKMLYDLGLVSQEIYTQTQRHPSQRAQDFVLDLYMHLADNKIYITNLAKCTQSDAKHLADNVFKEHIPSFYQELSLLKSKKVVTFGNQVSSIILGKSVTVSSYMTDKHETLEIDNQIIKIYPCWYPVGMGYRNIHKAKERIQNIIK